MLSEKNILLIDDDEISNFISAKTIETIAPVKKINAYSNPQKALYKLKKQLDADTGEFPDLIFLDINMPLMDGWQFLEEFEKFPEDAIKECKVFILSTSLDPSDIKKAAGFKTACGFISKPLTPEKLSELYN